MAETKEETKIERMLEETKDGDLVELILKENNLPSVKENYSKNGYVRITIGLKKLSYRPSYGMDTYLIRSVTGYYGQWFGKGGDMSSQQVIIYPMCQEVLGINSTPPIRIEVPLTEIESYKIIQRGEKPVTPPTGFP